MSEKENAGIERDAPNEAIRNLFEAAFLRAIEKTWNGKQIFSTATAVLVDVSGKRVAFGSTNDGDPDYNLYAQAADTKAKTRARIFREVSKRGGLFKHQKIIKHWDYSWHDGASEEPIWIDGRPYFMGASCAVASPELKKKYFGRYWRETVESDKKWRGAGRFDTIFCNLVGKEMTEETMPKKVKLKRISRKQGLSEFEN